jgi:CO/xanthine dehydrogenase Mo-binding subunit
MSLRYVGKDIPRVDALRKVNGTLDFVIDKKMTGMLYGKILRSEYAHAKILNIESSAAKELPGVYGIFTSNELPQPVPRFGPIKNDQPLLADQITRYHGEPVAIILADSDETAQRGLKLIKVEYEVLPAVSTIEDALKSDTSLVNEAAEESGTNIYGNWNFNWGDVESKKGKAFYTLENAYYFPMTHHFPIEPYSCISYPDDDGVVISSPIQHPFILRRVAAQVLNLKLSQVRIISNAIGGGFGGKGYPKIEPLAAYLALHTKRPVKITLSLDEGFFSARRSSANVTINTGFNKDGTIQYQDIKSDFLIGAYADTAPRVAEKSSYLACGPYRTPNASIQCRAIYSNTVPSTAFRGFGMPQLIWALESQMNEASRALGLDELEIRLRNLPPKGDVLIPGDTPVDGEWADGIRKAAELIGWGKDKGENVGRGLAIGIKSPIPASVSNAIAKLHPDASVTVSVGTTEMGQGARTVMTQITAETLGVPIDSINIIMGDTSAVPFDTSTAASRSTVSMGNAVASACKDIVNQLKEAMRELYEPLSGPQNQEITIADGLVSGYGRTVPLTDLLKNYIGPHLGELIGKGTFKGKKAPDLPIGGFTDFWEMVFTGVELTVDPTDGKIQLTKMVNVSDIGCVINPLQAKAQEEGAAIMGIGHTLMEHMVYSDSSQLRNGGALDYRIPTSMDLPTEFKSSFMENKDGPGPFGSKGLGESGIIAVAPAISGALSDAINIRVRNLPLTSEKVWEAIQQSKKPTPVK